MKQTKQGITKLSVVMIVVTVIIIGSLLYVAFFSTQNSFIRNSAQLIPTNEQVLAQRPQIADADNSYYDLIALKGLIPASLPQVVLNYAAGSTTSAQNIKDLKKIVTQYKDAFAIFDASTEKPYYFCDDKVKKEVCNYSDIRNIALLNSVRSGMLFENGKYADAMNISMNTLKFAQKLQQPSDSLMEYLISLAVKRIALQRISIILKSGKISQEAFVAYQNLVSQYADNKGGQKNVLKIEQLGGFTLYINAITTNEYKTFFSYTGVDENDADMKSVVNRMQEVKTKNAETWDPYTTYNLLHEVYSNEVANIDLPCGSAYPSVWRPDETLDYSKPTKNIIGQLIYANALTELNDLNVQRCSIDNLTNAVVSMSFVK